MRRSHTTPTQFDLFAAMESEPVTVPQWHNLPSPTRHKVTSLVAWLLMEHGLDESNELAGDGVPPLPSGEAGDV